MLFLVMLGMFIGFIIGMVQVFGEIVFLLFIGMVVFIVDVFDGFFDFVMVLLV